MNTRQPDRRAFLSAAAAGLAAARVARAADGPGLTFGFSLYGMKSLSAEEACRTLADIGYDSVELCLLPAYDTEPTKLSADRRKRLADLLGERKLALPALMENLDLNAAGEKQAVQLDRLKRAFELARDLAPDRPPLVETVMGGGMWDKVKDAFRDRLGAWAAAAAEAKVVLAVKPHRFGAVNRPADALWLLEQVRSPWLKVVYDYSHYDRREFTPADTVRQLAPHTAFVHVKDTVIRDGKAAFVLPGDGGSPDYVELLGLLAKAGYRGDVCCEVSGQVSNQKGYDAVAAAKKCYANLAPAFAKAGVRRAKAV
jgi:sugar phosphate isomerase/epimerase